MKTEKTLGEKYIESMFPFGIFVCIMGSVLLVLAGESLVLTIFSSAVLGAGVLLLIGAVLIGTAIEELANVIRETKDAEKQPTEGGG